MFSYLYLCKDRRVIHHYLSGLKLFLFWGVMHIICMCIYICIYIYQICIIDYTNHSRTTTVGEYHNHVDFTNNYCIQPIRLAFFAPAKQFSEINLWQPNMVGWKLHHVQMDSPIHQITRLPRAMTLGHGWSVSRRLQYDLSSPMLICLNHSDRSTAQQISTNK